MLGKFLTLQVFTVLRELTATDLKGSLLQLLYESGQSEMEWGTFFMNRANKKEGACLYNKRLTSTLNTLPPAVEGANDRSKYMYFMIKIATICGDRMRYPDHRRLMHLLPRHYSCSFFFGTTFVDLQIKGSSEGTETCLIKVCTVKVYLPL